MTAPQPAPRRRSQDISDEERRELVGLTVRRDVPAALSLRAQIVLACAAGRAQAEVASDLGVHPSTVSKWRARFETGRLDALFDDPRPGAARSIADEQVEEVVLLSLSGKPPGSDRWTSRAMAEATGLSQSAIVRIWKACGLRPWLADPSAPDQRSPLLNGAELIGLYINPPERAFAVVVDPRSDAGPGPAVNSTIATLGRTVDRVTATRRDSENRRTRASALKGFLERLDARTPVGPEIEVIVHDEGATRTTQIQQWLARHPRFRTRRVPSSGYWSKALEAAGPPRGSGGSVSFNSVERELEVWGNRSSDGAAPFIWCCGQGEPGKTGEGSESARLGPGNEGGVGKASERPTATRRVIAEQALAIIHQEGLAALSMERLASSLGIRGPSLYHHYADKSEILTEVARLVVLATPLVPEPEPAAWREWQVQQSLGYRRSILAYPNTAPLLLGYRTRELFPDQYERVSSVLVRAGVPYRYHLVVFETTDRFTFASAMYAARTESAEPEFFPRLDAEATPTLAEAVDVNPWNPEQIFTQALRHFLAQIPDGRKRLR